KPSEPQTPNLTAFEHLIGESPAMQALKRKILKQARRRPNILLLGPSGVGKEAVARAIHRASRRATGPFHPVTLVSHNSDDLQGASFGIAEGVFGRGAPRQGA